MSNIMIIVQPSPSVTHTTHHISRAHSASKMAEDGHSSKGSHQASEGYPREGLHWLIVQSSWFQLEIPVVETRPYGRFMKIKPGNQDGKKDHPGLASCHHVWQPFLVAKCILFARLSGQSPVFLCCFHVSFWMCSVAPQWPLVPVPWAVQRFADVRKVVNMCSKWWTRSVPSQALLVKWLMLGWDWNQWIVYHGKTHLTFFVMPFPFQFMFVSCNFHLFPRSVHNASEFPRDRERERENFS